MSIEAKTFVEYEKSILSFYFSELSDYDAASSIVDSIEDILRLHQSEMLANLDFISNIASDYKENKYEMGSLDTILLVGGEYIKTLVKESIAYAATEFVEKFDLEYSLRDSKTYGDYSHRYGKKINKEKGLKLAKFAKNIVAIKTLLALTEIMTIHNSLQDALEIKRKNAEASKKLEFNELILRENSALNNRITRLIIILRKKILLEKNLRINSFIVATCLIFSLNRKNSSGLNIYESFNAVLIHEMFVVFGIKSTFVCNLYKDHRKHLLKSIHISNTSLGALQKYLNKSNLTLFDVLFNNYLLPSSRIPVIKFEISFPECSLLGGGWPDLIDGPKDSVTLELNQRYPLDASDYRFPNGNDSPLFEVCMVEIGLIDSQKPHGFARKPKYQPVYFPWSFTGSRFKKMHLSNDLSKFVNDKKYNLLELDDL